MREIVDPGAGSPVEGLGKYTPGTTLEKETHLLTKPEGQVLSLQEAS